jgi:hypothetical protein
MRGTWYPAITLDHEEGFSSARKCASVPTPSVRGLYPPGIMAKSKQLNPPAATLEELLDKVSNAREELVAIERTLERLRANVTRLQKTKTKPKR